MDDKIRDLHREKEELRKKIERAKEYKEKVVDYGWEAFENYSEGKIDGEEYNKIISKGINGASVKEWADYYDKFIARYSFQLKKIHDSIENEGRRGFALKHVPLVIPFIILLATLFSVYYLGGGITGFASLTGDNIYSEELNLIFNESGAYEWNPANIGEITELKVSGRIAGEGKVRIILEDKVVFEGAGQEIQEGSAEGIEINLLDFENECLETCELPGFELRDSHKLNLEIDGAVLYLDRVDYRILDEDKENENGGVDENISDEVNDKSGDGKISEEKSVEARIKSEKRVDRNEFPPGIGRHSLGKRVVVTGPEDAKNVPVIVKLPADIRKGDEKRVRIYWAEENAFLNRNEFRLYDSNGDDLFDEVEITVRHFSDQTFYIIIEITAAEHLDAGRNFISDIYEEVKELDGKWSETITDKDYVRVTFERNLTSENDITIFPRIVSGTPRIEVYEKGKDVKIAEFDSLRENEYNTVILENLQGLQDSFDLRVFDGNVEFDHIIDPPGTISDGGTFQITAASIDVGSTTTATVTLTKDNKDAETYEAIFLEEQAGAGQRITDVCGANSVLVNDVTVGGTASCSAASSNSVHNDYVSCGSVTTGQTIIITYTVEGCSGGAGSLTYSLDISSSTSGKITATTDTLTVNAAVDNTYPVFSEFTEVPANNSAYSSGTSYEFNSTVTSTNGSVELVFGGINYTASNISATIFSVNVGDLAAGTYNYYWFGFGNGNDNNYNLSSVRGYTVAKRTPLGSISGTSSITYGTAGDIQGSESNAGDGAVAYFLYRDNVSVSNPDTAILGAGTYNYIYNATGGQNYTDNSSMGTFILQVNQAASEVNLTLNNTEGNITISAGKAIYLNATLITGDSGGTLRMYNDGTLINEGTTSMISNLTTFSSEGFFNITAVYVSSQNYTSSSETYWVNVTAVTNAAPTIDDISNILPQSVTESGVTNVIFNVLVSDGNGVDDINDAGTYVNFSKSGEENRGNSSCLLVGDLNSTTANYTCTIGLWYWDGAGVWDVNASAVDISQESSADYNETFTLSETTCMVMAPNELGWGTLFPGDTNQLSNADPITINNTCNDDIEDGGVKVNAINLIGEENPAYIIPAANFTAHISDACDAGSALVNATAISISGAVISAGNNSAGQGQEELYFCLEEVPSSLISQAYSTAVGGAWEISILAAALVFRKKRKKKKELTEDNLVDVLEEKLKERYGVSLKDFLPEKNEKIDVPLEIFNGGTGAAESLCRYLKDVKGLKYKEIASLLNRDQRTVWTSYHSSVRKSGRKTKTEYNGPSVPLEIFSDRRLSVLESVVIYLRVKGFRNSEIARILGRDPRNIWTLYSRAAAKTGKYKNI